VILNLKVAVNELLLLAIIVPFTLRSFQKVLIVNRMNWFYVLRTSINRQPSVTFPIGFEKLIILLLFIFVKDILDHSRHSSYQLILSFSCATKMKGALINHKTYTLLIWLKVAITKQMSGFLSVFIGFFMSDCFVIDFWLIVPKLKCNLTPFTHNNTFISYHTYVSVYVNYKDFILFTIIFTRQSSTLKDVCKKNLIKMRQNWMDILLLVNMVMQPMYYVVILTAMFLS